MHTHTHTRPKAARAHRDLPPVLPARASAAARGGAAARAANPSWPRAPCVHAREPNPFVWCHWCGGCATPQETGCSGVAKAIADLDAIERKAVAAGAKKALAGKKTKQKAAKDAVAAYKKANPTANAETDTRLKGLETEAAAADAAVVAASATVATGVCAIDACPRARRLPQVCGGQEARGAAREFCFRAEQQSPPPAPRGGTAHPRMLLRWPAWRVRRA